MERIIITATTGTAQVNEIIHSLGQLRETEALAAKSTSVRVNATANRTTSQLYFNNYTGAMYVSISGSLSAPGTIGANLQVGGATIAQVTAAAGSSLFLMGIVGPKESYLLTATGGFHVEYWSEYVL